ELSLSQSKLCLNLLIFKSLLLSELQELLGSSMVTSGHQFLFLSSMVPLDLKLDRSNFAFWCSQILATIRAHDLEGFLLSIHPRLDSYLYLQAGEGSSTPTISGSVHRSNPEYSIWIRTDQALMS
ncbi:hypothetical protein PanWU01x14_130110, partial [Parasponia andersonii]